MKHTNFANIIQIGFIPLLVYALFREDGIFWWSIFALFCFLGTEAVHICYHHELSHKSIKTSKWFRRLMSLFGMFYILFTPFEWVAQHIYHHKNCDTDIDPVSPARQRWKVLFYHYHEPTGKISRRWYAHILKDKFITNMSKNYYKIILSVWFLALIIDVRIFLYVFALPCLFTLWNQIGYLLMSHRWSATDGKCHAVDSRILDILTFGEGQHKEHHRDNSTVRGLCGYINKFFNTNKA
jgi:stearoyl-CoA desaturase (delta-9 desaturase)